MSNMKWTRQHGGERDGDYRLLVGYNSMPEGVKEAIRDNAKHGKEHPDPVVAASALTWAYESQSARRRLSNVLGVLMGALAALLGDLGVGADLRSGLADRKTAKRLIQIDRSRTRP
jgi:hypothetical protein